MGLFDFSLIRRSVQSLEERLKALRVELNDLQRQRALILSAPMNRNDLKQFLNDWLKASASSYASHLQAGLQRLAKAPHAGALNFDGSRGNVRLLGAATNFGESPSGEDMDRALCGLFMAPLAQYLAGAVDALDLPGEGLPMKDRPAAVEKLDSRIAALMQEEASLIEQAREAGINLQ
ncbi:MAG: hypothetical protein RIQ60_3593 [Pseudomonadota bacterium]